MHTKSFGFMTRAAVGLVALFFAAGAAMPSSAPLLADKPGTGTPANTSGTPANTSGTPGETSDKKITICHIPPGNTGNPQTLSISINAWRTDGKGEGGHGPGLHGGDYLGPCVGAGATAPATMPAVSVGPSVCGNWVFYHSNRTGNVNIFRLEIASLSSAGVASPTLSATEPTPGAGGGNIDISQGKGAGVQDISPAHAPDDVDAAFATNRDGHWEIYIGSAAGFAPLRLTNSKGDNTSPMWSPEGKSIVYESTRDGSKHIYLADVTTHQETALTSGKADDINPVWSPDSKKILFQSNRDGLWQIYELTLDGMATKALSDKNSNDANPQYSPDGSQIAFRSYPKSGSINAVISTMSVDGTNRQEISDPKGNALNLAWSPDMGLIAYQSNLTGASAVYVYQISSKQTRQVTDGSTQSSAPTWTCDSSTLIYTSVVNGNTQLFQTPALPIDAKPVKAADASELTGDNATNQNPENFPAVEDASHRSREQ
ncbi:MAG TPA: DPP IV N-terminal domain-containing protein [Aggregatilineales bacterium]|nr:DPP IV N-terminal domain-containing protein [Aggregatilineales bacterium]